MSKQPEALRLADALSAAIKQVDADDDVIHVARWFVEEAAAELRRQHAEIESLRREQEEDQCAIRVWRRRADQAEAKSDALLEALRVFVSCALPVSTEIDERGHRWTEAYLDQALLNARAAIKAVEEGK